MRVLVTGAARAIGASTVTELSARGHEVVATARHVDRLAGLDAARRLPLDVTDGESVARALAAAGEIDAVVNNAALIVTGPLEGLPPARFAQILDTNVIGALRVVQGVAPAWRRRGSGVVVNVSSVQGQVTMPLRGAYAASKHALEALSEGLHRELGHFGIRVVMVEPGYVGPGMKALPDEPGPPDYAPLMTHWSEIEAVLDSPARRTPPEAVAVAVADAIEDPRTPLRVEVGGDAREILAARRSLDDPSFEERLRQIIGFTW